MALCLAQIDSTIRQSTANVLACSTAAIEKDKDRDSYLVVLDDTCLYPGGGGQPCDTGVVGGRRCSEVREEGRQQACMTIYYCESPTGDREWFGLMFLTLSSRIGIEPTMIDTIDSCILSHTGV